MSNIKCNSTHVVLIVCMNFVLFTVGTKAASLPPDPNNAALLYYQAMLRCPEPNLPTFLLLENVMRGADPNERIRNYMNSLYTKATIELIQSATKLHHCDWGTLYSRGNGAYHAIMSSLQRLSLLMDIRARILCADGQYRSAFEHCLGIRRMARHIGDDTYFQFQISLSVNGQALRCIQYILGCMPPDAKTITWLKEQLAIVKGPPYQLERTLKLHRDLDLQYLRIHPDTLAWQLKKDYPEAIEDESIRERLFAHASESYDNFLESSFQIIRSDISHRQKCSELDKLTTRFQERADAGNRVLRAEVIILGEAIPYMKCSFRYMIWDATRFNALMAALEIYLAKIKTGRLPERLPDELPRHPYSDKDFRYEITKDGFTLRYDIEYNPSNLNRPFSFQVQ